ncbi:wax ester/triacylglycerol synthase family O-acyltransferase [Parahaliea maris]|uniref:diacylglycerol O-acyltransferase n=1 Tax=Parahaliea maris TaxID=2716870 RepID=A0A5C9A688_9GAMM|nr:wax ester/triacylglycerol synthase family O-acyltransferase [Parahaliea maris]TXS95522.1 wax ester/triacylglycerol synthase family O-acyltransferase [Parahaliea maris]
MKQLSPIDSMFVFNEREHSPMHIGPVMIYDPSSSPEDGPVRFKDVLEVFRSRLRLSPVFRRKLVKVPLDIDNPYWVEDENFDLEFHVRHLALPKPGDWRQFCILIGRLHSRPLDMKRPPWEAYIIEGLDNIEGLPPGCFAMYMKIHHSAIDGATGNQIVSELHDLSPIPSISDRPDEWRPEAVPSQWKLLSRSYINLLKQPSKAVSAAKTALGSLNLPPEVAASKEGMLDHGIRFKTRFNRDISPHRVFGSVVVELEAMKAIKNTVGDCTLNDVVLAVFGGALRKYLQDKDELPEGSMVAGVPISTRRPDQHNAGGGNAVAGMRLTLGTDIEDPLQRLRAINADAVASKAYANAVSASLMVDVAESVPTSVAALGMRLMAATGLTSRNPVVHTIVTNVPGAQTPVYMCGAKAINWIGAGCPVDGVGLFNTINSYNGLMSLAFICDRDMMPDPQFYQDCIQESFTELETAARNSAKKTRAPARGKTGRAAKGSARPKSKAATRKA